MSVTVFGLFNCYFGGVRILATLFTFLMLGPLPGQLQAWITVTAVSGLALGILLLMTGIGLIRMKRWARRGSVICACFVIPWSILWVILGFRAPIYDGMVTCLTDCCNLFSLIVIGPYSILLLIFMNTRKVREAFNK